MSQIEAELLHHYDNGESRIRYEVPGRKMMVVERISVAGRVMTRLIVRSNESRRHIFYPPSGSRPKRRTLQAIPGIYDAHFKGYRDAMEARRATFG